MDTWGRLWYREGNTICDSVTNLKVSGGAEMPGIDGNDICPDVSAEASE